MTENANLLLPLVLAGAALAGLGVLRLATPALARMPRRVAAAAVLGGVVVAALGFVLEPEGEEPPEPTIALDPIASPDPHTADVLTTDVNGVVRTADGEGVAATEVMLHRFERTDEVDRLETTTDEHGQFSFGDLEVGPQVAYIVDTTYEETVFSSGLLLPGAHGRVELVVAPPTQDESVVRVDVDSTVLVGDEEGIQVVHILALRNTSDEAFVGELRLPLLPGASGLVPRRGLDRTKLSVTGDDLVSFAPLLPGETEVVYEYGLPPRDTDPNRRLLYPTERLEVLVAGELQVDAGRLRQTGDVRLGATGTAREFRRYSASGLESGDEVELAVRVGGRGLLEIVLIVAGVVIALAIVLVGLVRRRRPSEPATDQAREPAPVADQP